ncbi:MAG: DUF4097 family beta strand repeat-containing protein [Lacrimispora sp.]|uniref:DUF4097 family beta strand repeat-containing protein n=1 Tax=Lacrimispora sp. TaxID=2719234 RepID=UPI0039E2CEC6
MRRFVRSCLIAGVVCMIIGGAAAISAAALGGNLTELVPENALEWRREISDAVWDELDYTDMELGGEEIGSFSGVKELEVIANSGKVVFVKAPSGDEIKVLSSRYMGDWDWDEEDGKLELEADYGQAITIQIPENYHFSSVTLESSHSRGFSGWKAAGSVMTAETISADKLRLETKAGVIKIGQAKAGRLEVESSAGSVEFTGRVDGDIYGECKAGSIQMELEGEKEDYNYDIECNVGEVNVAGESIAGLRSSKKKDNNAGKTMDLECSTGSIQVDFIKES